MRGKIKGRRDGQAILEYILLLFLVIGFYTVVAKMIKSQNLGRMVAQPIQKNFAMAYKYGYPTAKGPDEGGPEFHPRFEGGNNFRLYLNPR